MSIAYEPILPRARIGFIIPSSNRMVEPHMQRFMPAGVVPHFTRIRMTNQHKAPLVELIPRISAANAEFRAEAVVSARRPVTSFMAAITRCSVSTPPDIEVPVHWSTMTSHFESASNSAACAKRLVFISETGQDDHDPKLAYLREAGYEIVADRAAGLEGTDAYCTMPPRLWYDTALALRNPAADAYFISCANIHSIDVIEDLERDLGKPVVTSNQAAIWCALRTVGFNEAIPGLGILLKHGLGAKAAVAA